MVRSFFARRKVRQLREHKENLKQRISEQQEARSHELADLRAQEIERRCVVYVFVMLCVIMSRCSGGRTLLIT